MGCLVAIMLLAGPRSAIFFWWLLNPDRWDAVFDTFIWPFIGFLLLPWTTLIFVMVAPRGDLSGFDIVWLAFAVIADLVSLLGGGYGGRRQVAAY